MLDRRAYSTHLSMQDLGPTRGQFQHLLIGDLGDVARVRHDPRVGGEHTVHIGVDLADVGLERRRQRDRGGVRTAPAQGGDVLRVLGHALEPGHDRDRALVQRHPQPARRHVDDPRPAVRGGGDHARLRAGVRTRLVPQVVDGHREQRHRDALTAGQQHVEFAPGRQRTHLVGEVEQFVRGVTHRGDDDHDVVASLAGTDDPLGDPLDALGVGDGGASVLLHNQAHSRAPPSLRINRSVTPIPARRERRSHDPASGTATILVCAGR